MDALKALVSDRHEILTGQPNALTEHEMKIAIQEAKEGRGHSPRLLQDLLRVRKALRPNKDTGSARGIITEMRELKTSLRASVERSNSRAAAELLIINDAMQHVQRITDEQTDIANGLDKEIELIKDTMNMRLEYYRQLQAISDTVAPFEGEMTDDVRSRTLFEKEVAEKRLVERVAALRSKGRYLVNLRDEASHVETQRLCVICRSMYETGVLTSCGHSYCRDCLRIWWGTHRNCPQCKQHLNRNDFHDITYELMASFLASMVLHS